MGHALATTRSCSAARIVHLQHQLDARRRATGGPVDRIIAVGSPDVYAVAVQGDVSDRRLSLITDQGETQDPRIERDDGVEVGGEITERSDIPTAAACTSLSGQPRTLHGAPTV